MLVRSKIQCWLYLMVFFDFFVERDGDEGRVSMEMRGRGLNYVNQLPTEVICMKSAVGMQI